MVLSVLSLVGVVNIGEPYNKQVYAVKSVGETLTDQVREICNSILANYRQWWHELLWVWPTCYYWCGLHAIIMGVA